MHHTSQHGIPTGISVPVSIGITSDMAPEAAALVVTFPELLLCIRGSEERPAIGTEATACGTLAYGLTTCSSHAFNLKLPTLQQSAGAWHEKSLKRLQR